MSEQLNFNNVKIFSIDLTTTDDCNFNCSYCFEHGFFNKNYFNDSELFIKKADELLNSFFFKSNYNLLGIGFWGGEPTLNETLIKTVVEYYSNDDRVKFFIYSNGSNIEPYIEILEKYKKITLCGHPKLCIQMSYDGMPIQDICRKTKDNKLTSNLVRNNIILLGDKEIPYVTKSTVILEAFKYLPEARRDLLDIVERYKDKNFFSSTNYFPTIDYYHLNDYTKEEIEQYYKELHQSLIEISRDEIEFYKKNKRFFFAWFNPNRAICCAGKDMICIHWDGNIFKCHGSVYENNSGEHFISNLNDKNFINQIINSNQVHSQDFGYEPKQCKNCVATFCLKCNSVKFNESKKESYIEKWRDYTDQPRLCKFYKLNGKIVLATKELLNL